MRNLLYCDWCNTSETNAQLINMGANLMCVDCFNKIEDTKEKSNDCE